MEKIAVSCYLSLGSNIGDRVENLQLAINHLKESSTITALSKVYETPPWGYESTNSYLNCCLQITTTLSPMQLLAFTQSIERQLGRMVKNNYQDRTIDIDILTYGTLEIHTDNLIIPHPLIWERAFVLVPLLDIDEKLRESKHFLTNHAQSTIDPKHSGIKEFSCVITA